MKPTGDYQRTFNIDAEYVWIDGLQFELWNRNNYSTTYSLYPFVKVGWISNNIFKGDSTDSGCRLWGNEIYRTIRRILYLE
ncbi:MAG: hypothetical protein KatS3mg027_2540 [Bacteroidia bacterium]|nr:MAG: hypothetical protein KatS3mg027_2540 [Bacteroidia bacterium]